ncbi:lytic transglycosylase domain-containing protein [Paenibacillus sp. 32O-W]|uniref:lytic transglycosylase domain-containing protein n=1 Tax=Paenibacillus sp. 32O-W TaxID=1695218 RepID=UPI0011A00EDE|nr:lytic transglycosylase domain-containing protein [Paenibacillus sp. 32O-W]
MSMKIDPRTVQQMLQLQLYEQTNIFSSVSPYAVGRSASTFAGLLEEIVRLETVTEPDPAPKSSGSGLVGQAVPHPSLSKPTTYDPLIHEAALKYGVDAALIKAVIHAESSFNPTAQSHAGAKGLMQLMDGTAKALGVADSMDPEQNINGGTRYLAALLAKYNGQEAVALAAYNAGPGRVDRLGIATERDLRAHFDRLPAETQNYITKVLDLKETYKV